MPKPDSKMLTTAAEVIDALGQPRVSELTGKSYKRVWGWGADGAFPSRYFLVMWIELVQLGYSAPPALWQQELSRNKEAVLVAFARKLKAA
jgi:predicted DNA-binding transcriptional regulator AlpA